MTSPFRPRRSPIHGDLANDSGCREGSRPEAGPDLRAGMPRDKAPDESVDADSEDGHADLDTEVFFTDWQGGRAGGTPAGDPDAGCPGSLDNLPYAERGFGGDGIRRP